jgi:hypothetical protein
MLFPYCGPVLYDYYETLIEPWDRMVDIPRARRELLYFFDLVLLVVVLL